MDRGTSLVRRIAVLVCLLVGVVTVMPPTASAQENPTSTTAPTSSPGDDSGLTISPAIIDNTVNAGATFSVPITLGNITSRAVPIEVTKGKLETDQTPNAANSSKYDISTWFNIEQPTFLLPAQDRKTVNIAVKVPDNAEPGGHYATVFFGALAPSDGGGSGETLLNARVGVVFLLTVRGEVRAGAAIDGDIQTQSLQLDAGTTEFSFALQNTGNVHFQPSGNLVIKDVFGRKVKELPLPIGIVLPGAEKQYSLVWERGIRPGAYTASVKIDAGISLEAKSKRFTILPLVLVVPIGIFLFVVVLIIWNARRRKKRRARRAKALEAITGGDQGEGESAEKPEAPSNVPPDPKEEKE